MIFDATCKAGNFRVNATNQPAVLKEGTGCYDIIGHRGLFKRKNRECLLGLADMKRILGFGANSIIFVNRLMHV